MRARQIRSAHHLRPAGKMLGSHSHTAFPSAHCIRAAKAIHDPQYIDHAIEHGSRNSSCRATAKWAHHWLPGASSPAFKARTRFPFRHQPTSPHYARACAGPAPITISRRRWAASALSYVQGGVGGQPVGYAAIDREDPAVHVLVTGHPDVVRTGGLAIARAPVRQMSVITAS